MDLRVVSASAREVDADWLVVGVPEGDEWPDELVALDNALLEQLSRLREAGDLTGKLAELLTIPDTPTLKSRRLLLVGLGPPAELSVARWDKAVMTAARQVSSKADVRVAVYVPEQLGPLTQVRVVEIAATALIVGSHGQDLFKAERSRFPFAAAQIVLPPGGDLTAATAACDRGRILGEAINLTRELVNRTPDEIYPETFAARAQAEAAKCELTCRVFDEKQLAAERFGSLLAVAKGSDRPARMVVLEHRGGAADSPTLALVGKGVTFDSGGLSIKPTDGMLTMKCDMAGAATVLGAMTAIARLKLPVNVIGYAGLVENMLGTRAFKLGDVLTARNGVTIEVHNTDAEGRLVINDVLSYAIDHGADRLIDLATLTGACVVALGEDVAGAFSNNQPWCDAVLAGAKAAGEDLWQLPMFDAYNELLKSDVADCKNVGGRWGGAITAAKFLEKFVAGKPWVHLDIAGPAFASANKGHREGGATGCFVRTLVEIAATPSP
ncbi:MAG: leucyl aminopeptidase [Planctomycetaceae bacterium]|nr:leucyl aminopeptidase [Planctomycetaceae bacterium]